MRLVLCRSRKVNSLGSVTSRATGSEFKTVKDRRLKSGGPSARLAWRSSVDSVSLLSCDEWKAGDDTDEEANYVSFTIWSDKQGFDAWRKGDAFKEAHGGGTIFGFMSMLVSSLMILKGGPKPAFYDGILPVSGAPSDASKKWQSDNGWRQVPADGKNPIDSDVFAAMNRFKVLEGQEAAFEKRWAERESELKDMPGFVTFLMLRRDAVNPDDGYNYSTYTVWENRAAFDNWRANGSKKAHAKAGEAEPMFEGRPSPVFYEGVLALLSPEGA